MTSSNLLREAVTAVKAGQRKRARTLLLELVEQQPDNEAAWLWLSDLVDDMEDRIIALENALTINPHRPKVQARLAQLQRQQAEQLAAWEVGNGVVEKFEEAMTALEKGMGKTAVSLLREVVAEDPDHEEAWYTLSTLIGDPDQKIAALENVLRINPNHAKAQGALADLHLHHFDQFKLGRTHEKNGELKKARQAYELAVLQTSVAAERQAAQKRLKIIEQKLSQSTTHLKKTSATFSLLRLTAGPPLLYGLLLIIHSGINPLRIPLLFYLGGLGVLLGSGLVAAASTPHHPLWQSIFGKEGMNTAARAVVIATGFFFLAPPFIFLLLNALNRLQIYSTSL